MLHFVASRVVFFLCWVMVLFAVVWPLSILGALSIHDYFWRDPSRGWFMNFWWLWEDEYDPMLIVFIGVVSLVASLLGLFPGYRGPPSRNVPTPTDNALDPIDTESAKGGWRSVLLLRKARSPLGWMARAGVLTGIGVLVQVNVIDGGFDDSWTISAIGNAIVIGLVFAMWLGAYVELRRP